MAKYDLIVLGDGVQDSGHGDYSNTEIVIARIKALNPRAKIFGYVTINQSLANFETKVDGWETLQVDGILLDEAGYDYGTTTTNGRDAFNTKVDYVHGQTYAKLCFANSWNMDHIIGTTNDGSYPNTTWNPNVVASNLTYNDYYLLESFAINTLSYGSNYEVKTDWAYRGVKAQAHRYNYGINLVATCVIQDGHTDASDLLDFAFTSSMMFALEGFGSSDDYYGASSAKTAFIERPDVTALGEVYSLSTAVQVDVGDSDVYHSYVEFGKLSVDFSTGAQTSSITSASASGGSGTSGTSGTSGVAGDAGTSGTSGVDGTSGTSGVGTSGTSGTSGGGGGSGSEYWFPIYAEENAGLSANAYEWAFGDRASTPNSGGVTIHVPSGWTCTLESMSLRLSSGTATVEAVLNGTPQGSSANVSVSTGQGAVNTFTGVGVNDGDYFNFRTTSASGTAGPNIVTGWFKCVK
jgi:hypothetical protein